MSRAFTREPDADAAAAGDVLPDRPISEHPNYVTRNGLAAIESTLRDLEAQRLGARERSDARDLAVIARELRYWIARRATAQVVEPAENPGVVRFGVEVALEFADGSRRMFRIVGEDEADPTHARLSYVSPLAQALLGARVGDVVDVGGRSAAIVSLRS